MKFKLKQDKLLELFEKLLMTDIFPSSVLATKEGKLFSIQKQEEGGCIRYAKFEKQFFEEIGEDTDSIMIDVTKALSLIKLVPATESIVVEKQGKKLCFTDSQGTTYINYEPPGKQFRDKLPFEFKDGIPYVGAKNLPLPTKFTVDLANMKLITNYGKALKTEFYQFSIKEDKSMSVYVGDLHDFSDGRDHKLMGEVLLGEVLKVCYTFGVPQMADTFRQEKFTMYTQSDSPALILEGSKEQGYQLALLIAPYVEEE